MRFSAAYTLGALNDLLARADLQPAIPALILTLQDPVDRVRMEAAQALGYLGDPSTIVALEPLAARNKEVPSEDDHVAQAAWYAIKAIRYFRRRYATRAIRDSRRRRKARSG